jgi:hypothetical protein
MTTENVAYRLPRARRRRVWRHRRFSGAVAILALLALVPGAGAHAVRAATTPSISQLAALACTSGGQEPCANDAQPMALLQGADGNFYGATATSVLDDSSGNPMGGTIVKVTPSGQLPRLFTFAPGPQHTFPDGNVPGADLVQGADGFLYGTTALGGRGQRRRDLQAPPERERLPGAAQLLQAVRDDAG